MERTAKLEQEVYNLTTVMTQQQNIMAEQSAQLKSLREMMERVGRPGGWLPLELKATIAPSEVDKLVQNRCAKWNKAHFHDYTDTAAMHVRNIVSRGNIKKLEPWFKEVDNYTEMTAEMATKAFENLVRDYVNQYGLGKWMVLTEADKDYEYTQARAPRTIIKQ